LRERRHIGRLEDIMEEKEVNSQESHDEYDVYYFSHVVILPLTPPSVNVYGDGKLHYQPI
jgi:hypothetical protein